MNALHVAERSAVYALENAVAPVAGEVFDLLATAPQGVAKLRQLILSLAIQGRLCRRGGASDGSTDQRFDTLKQPHETPSRADRDTHARQRDMGIIVPFHIPATWQWSALGEVVDIIRGITFPASEKRKSPDEGLIACLRTANVQNVIEWDDLLYVNRSFMRRDDQRVRPMDIIMSMANSKDLVGKVALIDDDPPKEATIGGFIAILRTQDMDPRYLMGVLRSDYVRSTLIDSSSQTTNIANISLAKLRPLLIPLPPLAEQRRIVARVEELMGPCDELETRGRLQDEQHARLVATLFDALVASTSPAELADNWQRIASHFDLLLDRPAAVDALEQTILQLAVRGLLVPQDPADEPAAQTLAHVCSQRSRRGRNAKAAAAPTAATTGTQLPAAAGWTRTEFSSTWQSSFYGPRFSSEDYVSEGGIPTVRTTDMSGGRIVLHNAPRVRVPDAKRSLYLVKKGDLLVTRSGSIGVMALFGLDEAAIPSAYLIRLRFNAAILPTFAYLYLTSPTGQALLGITATSVGVPNVSAAKMEHFGIDLPPVAEQHRIVARVEELRSLCADLRRHLQQAQATQSNLADALVNVAVQDNPTSAA